MNNGVFYLDPPSIPASPFSSRGAVLSPGIRIIETGGRTGLAPEAVTPADQAQRALESIRAILAEAGATPEDIFQVRILLVEGQDPLVGFTAWRKFMAAHRQQTVAEEVDTGAHPQEFSGPPHPPPLVTVAIVSALAVPDALVEIEARAAIAVDGMNGSARATWIEYLQANPALIAEGVCDNVTAWSFGAGKDMADELVALVLAGVKRATATSLEGLLLEREPVPRRGQHSVILDGDRRARCIIRTGKVVVGTLGEVTAAFARREGEGDGSREYWLEAHRRFFGAEHRRLGLAFSDGIPVVFEEFEVVWPSGA